MEKETILVSVIIPVYNIEQYLSESINSVINQTYKNTEIICINDGSTDSSLDILNGFAEKDPRIKILNKENGGASAARNEGIREAQGKYILFLDSDDYIIQNAIELLLNQAEKEELDILFFGAESFFESREIEKAHEVYKKYYERKQLFDHAVSGDRMLEKMMEENLYRCSVPLQFIRRSFLVKSGVRFVEGIMHEDEAFSALLLVQAERTMCTTDSFYRRRVRDNSVMTAPITSFRFESLFIVSMVLAANAITRDDYSTIGRSAILKLSKWKYRHALEVYRSLPRSEQKKISSDMPEQYRMLYQEMKASFELCTGEKEVAEILRIKNSYSYKIGRVITFIPRKIKGGIQCYYDHGLRYTVRHFYEKLKNAFFRILRKKSRER